MWSPARSSAAQSRGSAYYGGYRGGYYGGYSGGYPAYGYGYPSRIVLRLRRRQPYGPYGYGGDNCPPTGAYFGPTSGKRIRRFGGWLATGRHSPMSQFTPVPAGECTSSLARRRDTYSVSAKTA